MELMPFFIMAQIYRADKDCKEAITMEEFGYTIYKKGKG